MLDKRIDPQARTVAKGFTQIKGIDYEKTFFYSVICLFCSIPSPGCPSRLRVVLNGRKDYFLQLYPEEEIYME